MSFHWPLFTAIWDNQKLNTSYEVTAMEQEDRFARRQARLHTPGYSTVKVRGPDGGESIRRMYTADYLQYAQSDRAWKGYKALYALCLMFGALLPVLSMCTRSVLNAVVYVNALELLSGLALLYFICTMLYQICAPRRMKLHQHKKAVQRVKAGAFAYGLCLALLTAAMLLFVITNAFPVAPSDIFCMAGPLLGAALSFLTFGLETKRRCATVPNNLPDNVIFLDDT